MIKSIINTIIYTQFLPHNCFLCSKDHIVFNHCYNILKPMTNDITIKLSKYVKPWFIPTATLINTLAILYYSLPIRIEFYMGVVALLLLALKFMGGYQHSPLYLIGSNDCALMLMEKVNIELIKLNWLINKFTKECFAYSVLAFGIFYAIDNYLSPSISVWIAINLINLYLSFTKVSKNVVKYHLGLYKEYNKYVIHIIEPNNQE
jgi:hypothetical protein